MNDVESILAAAGSFLLVDWPTRDVPDTLALAGFEVVAHGGPGPEDYFAYEVVDGEVVERHVGRPPRQADVVYSFRPLDELPDVIRAAEAVGARAMWIHSGQTAEGEDYPSGCWLAPEAAAGARALVEAAGMDYVDAPYIADAVRARG